MTPDIVKRIQLDFGTHATEATEAIEAFAVNRHGGHDCDRILRCIIYLAEGRMEQLWDAIGLAEKDYRDLIMAAEYECTDQRIRDFGQPFE